MTIRRTAITAPLALIGEGKAAITDDFVLTAQEVNPVLRGLRADGIEVTALHSHFEVRVTARLLRFSNKNACWRDG